MKITIITVLLISLKLSPIFASSEAYRDSTTDIIFDGLYYDSYKTLMCSHNVAAIIESFREGNIGLEKSYVVHVRTSHPQYAPVNAYASRSQKSLERWSFHAFLIHQGSVYDMDFQTAPTPVHLNDYLVEMFFPKGIERQKLLYQIKPALKYSSNDFDGTMNLKKYPLRSFTIDFRLDEEASY